MKRPNTKPTVLSLPSQLSALENLAYNLWWSWTPTAQELFREIDPQHWEQYHNPVRLLREASRQRLDELADDPRFCTWLGDVVAALEAELSRDTWLQRTHPEFSESLVAYLCAEFGFHESLPIYSGGLGILAGDHTKSASDLGIPFLGIGLVYHNGYFKQQIDHEGNQKETYPDYDFTLKPLRLVVDADGRDLLVGVELPGRTVYARVWLVEVGRSLVLLLDTDFAANHAEDRLISHQLYGGDREMRISQEIVLGIGGVRVIRALGYKPAAWHMNEGHVAFSTLERIRNYMLNEHLSLDDAIEAVTASTVFTTHTPVPAGNEAFSLPLIDKYFRSFCKQLDIDLPDLMQLGLQKGPKSARYFSMTVMALRLSCKSNGVSALHGDVSQRMWADLWPGVPPEENPITSITNGVHTKTWLAPEMAQLFTEHIGADWSEHLADKGYWESRIACLSDEAWLATHHALKQKLIAFVRAQLQAQFARHQASPTRIAAVESWLHPDILTIGFARRFATYKRAKLLFTDLKRLERIVNHPQHPVQLIFAGKAHPADKQGQALIKEIWQYSQQDEFLGKIVILENYDMNMARYLVQGVDVWLNNPRRPQEASGTSGQKVPINGGINFSVLDGWWPEAYNGENGWKIGFETEYLNTDVQDADDARTLYETLESEIIPLYYDQRVAEQKSWMSVVRNSMVSVIPVFNTEVMVRNYFEKLYKVAMERHCVLLERDLSEVAAIAQFKETLRENWPLVHFTSVHADLERKNGKSNIHIAADLYLGELHPDHVDVELYCSSTPENGAKAPLILPLTRVNKEHALVNSYFMAVQPPFNGETEFKLRVVPRHPVLAHKHELGLIHWKELE